MSSTFLKQLQNSPPAPSANRRRSPGKRVAARQVCGWETKDFYRETYEAKG